MNCSPLANYLRAHRKRSGLSQAELAFLLAIRSPSEISRYEHGQQTPKLRKLLAYQFLFQTPIREMYDGVSVEVEREMSIRVELLIQELSKNGGRLAKRKIAALQSCLDRLAA